MTLPNIAADSTVQQPQATKVSQAFGWAKWLLAAWIVGSMVFAHGCHGDEDTELLLNQIAPTWLLTNKDDT